MIDIGIVRSPRKKLNFLFQIVNRTNAEDQKIDGALRMPQARSAGL
jgi:hypothetical protein